MKNFLNNPRLRNHLIFNYRGLWACMSFAALIAMLFALYLEHVVDLAPCNLCMLQRAVMILLGIISFLAFIHNPIRTWGKWVYAISSIMLSIVGLLITSRHVWLQHLPENRIPACGPDFEYLMEAFPITESILMILQGSGECAEVSWTLLGLSIPEQLLATFTGFMLVSLIQGLRVYFNIIDKKDVC